MWSSAQYCCNTIGVQNDITPQASFVAPLCLCILMELRQGWVMCCLLCTLLPLWVHHTAVGALTMGATIPSHAGLPALGGEHGQRAAAAGSVGWWCAPQGQGACGPPWQQAPGPGDCLAMHCMPKGPARAGAAAEGRLQPGPHQR